MLLLAAALADCRMELGVGYARAAALECARVPQLSADAFEQTQRTFEMLFAQLYGFAREAADPGATDYPAQRVDLAAGLRAVRREFEEALRLRAPVAAYDYFAALQALLLRLRDTHTGFAKPRAFNGFDKFLPFVVQARGGAVVARHYTGSLRAVGAMYERAFGAVAFREGERIRSIGGLAPFEFLRAFARDFGFWGRSEHSHVNYLLLSALSVRHDARFNIFAEADEFAVEFEEGRTVAIRYMYTSDADIDADAMRRRYSASLRECPYSEAEAGGDGTDSDSAARSADPELRNPIDIARERFDAAPMKQRLLDLYGIAAEEETAYGSGRRARDVTLFDPLIEVENFFQLFRYNQRDLFLYIPSFSPNYPSDYPSEFRLLDVHELQLTIKKYWQPESRLFISVLGNSGGLVVLN